jgi:hypothetical protein
MDKWQYFEMCEQLGTEPNPDDIPVEFEDFIWEVQEAFEIYNLLKDEWDGFNGLYLGKSLIGITEIFDISGTDTDQRHTMILLIKLIDRVRVEELNRKQEKPAK